MGIKVRAIQKGFYDNALRIPGTPNAEFEIKNKSELGSWLVQINDKGEVVKTDLSKAEQAAQAKAEQDAKELQAKIEQAKHNLAEAEKTGDQKTITKAKEELDKLSPPLA